MSDPGLRLPQLATRPGGVPRPRAQRFARPRRGHRVPHRRRRRQRALDLAPLPADGGRTAPALGWRSTNTDITAKRRDLDELNEHRQHLAELVQQRTAELTAAKAMAEAANAAMNQFLGQHEPRDPHAAQRHAGHGASDQPQRSEPGNRTDHLGKFDVSARHLLDIVNDIILDLSKIEAGKLAMEILPCGSTWAPCWTNWAP